MPSTDLPNVAATLRASLQLQPGERLYAIVDACQNAELALEAGYKYEQPIRMLFEGDAAQSMRELAPYLVPIDLNQDYLERFVDCWDQNVGVLLVSAASESDLFRHLRDIFVVQDERGQAYFFRYYDPRVLRVYLGACTPVETQEFFGPIRRFLVPAEESGGVLTFLYPARASGSR